MEARHSQLFLEKVAVPFLTHSTSKACPVNKLQIQFGVERKAFCESRFDFLWFLVTKQPSLFFLGTLLKGKGCGEESRKGKGREGMVDDH